MTFKTLFVDARYSDAVSSALTLHGWAVSAADLSSDGFLVNHIVSSELQEAAEIALLAMEKEEDGNDAESLSRLTSIHASLLTLKETDTK